MIERFLFYRVNAKTGGAAIGSEHHLVVDVLANETGAALAFMQFAVTRAEIALDARRLSFRLGQSVPPTCWMR